MTNSLSNIPTLDAVNPGAVENAASGISKAGSGIRAAGGDVASAWSKLHGVYKAPEAGELIGAVQPVEQQTNQFGWQAGQVGAALSDYAAEIAPVKAKLTALKAAAGVMLMDQAATDGGESHWRRKQSNVDAENKLLHEVAVALNEAHQIAAKCANRINGLVGGVQYHGGGVPTGKPDAYWSLDPSHLSWAQPVKKDYPWWRDGVNGAVGVGKGVVVDGAWGMVKGVGAMAGFGPKGWDWHNVWHSYKAIETLGMVVTVPGSIGLPSVRNAAKNFGKDFVAWDDWKKDKGRAAGKVVFNVITLGVPETRLGMAGKAGDAALAVTKGVNKVDVVGHGLSFGIRYGTKGVTAGLDAVRNLHVGEGLTHLKGIHVNGLDALPDTLTPKVDPGHFHLNDPRFATPRLEAPHQPVRPPVHEVPHTKPTVRQVADHVESKYQHDDVHGGNDARGGGNGTITHPPRTHTPAHTDDPATPGGGRDGAGHDGSGHGSGGHGGGHGGTHDPSNGNDPFQQHDHGQGHDPAHDPAHGQSDAAHPPHGSDGAFAHDPDVPGEIRDGYRHFSTNEAGERYGEDYLSDTYRHLPHEEQHAIREYTRHSWPYNYMKRLDSPVLQQRLLDRWKADVGDGWDLFKMNGGKTPTMPDIRMAARRTDLSLWQRTMVNDILGAKSPARRLDHWIANSGARGMLTRTFGHFPTLDDIYARMGQMDQALSHPIPESVEVQRGLGDVDFVAGFDKHNPHGFDALVGKEHEEPGYTSTSLGSDSAFADHKFRFHIKVPEGSPGLWMGRESVYQDQRELILPPGTKYRITKVSYAPDGKIDVEAVVIP